MKKSIIEYSLYILIGFLLPVNVGAQTKTASRKHNGYTVTYTYDTTKPQWIWDGVGRKKYFPATIHVSSQTSRGGRDIKGLYRPMPNGGTKDSVQTWIDKSKSPIQ